MTFVISFAGFVHFAHNVLGGQTGEVILYFKHNANLDHSVSCIAGSSMLFGTVSLWWQASRKSSEYVGGWHAKGPLESQRLVCPLWATVETSNMADSDVDDLAPSVDI